MNKRQRLDLLGILLAILFAIFYQLIWIFDPMRLGSNNIYWTDLIDYLIYFFIFIPIIWMVSSLSDLIFLWRRRAQINQITILRAISICIKLLIIFTSIISIFFIIKPPIQLYYFGILIFSVWFFVLINTFIERLILFAKLSWKALSSIFFLCCLVAIIFWPTSSIVTYPGLTINMNKYVTVEEGYDGGNIIGVLVFERLAFPIDYLFAQFFPHYDFRPLASGDEMTAFNRNSLLSKPSLIISSGYTLTEFTISENIELPLEHELHIYRLLLLHANSVAVNIALREANLADHVTSQGVLVIDVLNNFRTETSIQVGDVIKSLNNQQVGSVQEFFHLLEYVQPDEQVELHIIRDNVTFHTTVKALPHPEQPSKAILDIQVIDNLTMDIPYLIHFHSFAIHEGGGSHGAILTFALVNQLTPEDMTYGNRVAGTGTINIDGFIGEIGGIKQKAYSVERAGADVFFVPHTQYEAAQEGATDLNIVPVQHINDILSWLKNNPKNRAK